MSGKNHKREEEEEEEKVPRGARGTDQIVAIEPL